VKSDGVFYTVEEHAKLVSQIKGSEAKCKARIEYEVKRSTIALTRDLIKARTEAEYTARQLDGAEAAMFKQRDLLLAEIAKRKAIPWHKSPAFVATLSVVSTVAVAAFSVWVFRELAQNR